MNSDSFLSLSILPELIAVSQELGFEKLTPIQAQSLPLLLQGKDVVGQAQTGSGKTVSYLIPILNQVKLEQKNLQALILCPTRELATQVTLEVRKWGRRLEGLQVLSLIGGQSGREQAQSIDRGVQIAVGTPGRVLDLFMRRGLDFSNIKTIVFDEADVMLDMGFAKEINAIMDNVPQRRQTILFSATFPDTIEVLSRKFQNKPVSVKIETEGESPEVISRDQYLYESSENEKVEVLLRVLQQHPAESTIVFCNMKATVSKIAERLESLGASYGVLHGDLEQKDRDRVMAMFRNQSLRVLIATDVAARGLDIEDLEMVVNFDFPKNPEAYIHRIGRTARAGQTGLVVLLADARDTLKVQELETATKSKFKRNALGFKNQHGISKVHRHAVMTTLVISGGRKDKLRAGDILGALTGSNSKMTGNEIGKIQIFDRHSYIAVKSDFAGAALEFLRLGKIKGQKFQSRILK